MLYTTGRSEMREQYYVAIDVGASSIKAIATTYEQDKIKLCNQIAFKNSPIVIAGNQHINISQIMKNINNGLQAFSKTGKCKALGIDTYGNGYGILNQDGKLISNPYYYRDLRTENIMEKVEHIISAYDLYKETGIFPIKSRVLFQLYCDVLEEAPAIRKGKIFLPLANLLEYFVCGEATAEHSIASVSYLLDRDGKHWNFSLFEKFGIPAELFPEIKDGGTIIGETTDEFADSIKHSPIKLVRTISHDTESALLAAPRYNDNKVFVSLGTSFIFGVQTDKPVITEQGYKYYFKNMQGAFGKVSLCKDFPGFWLLNQCMKQWKKNNISLTYDDICMIVSTTRDNNSYINVSDSRFRLDAEDIPKEIQEYCIRTGQPSVEGIGPIAKCLFESYALQLRWCFECLKEITNKYDYQELAAISGGVHNHILMQMIADALEIPVVTGSPLASSIGNILMQLHAHGEVDTLQDMREIAYHSSEIIYYESHPTPKWRNALAFMKEKQLLNG